MNVDDAIGRLKNEIKVAVSRILWLRKHRDALADLPEGSFFSGQLDFDRLPHAETIKVIRKLGGRWQKQLCGADSTKVNYLNDVDGVHVRIWNGDPPPSCRIVEVEQVIPPQPARVIKVKKMICSGRDEPVAVAIARAQPNQPTQQESQ